MKTRPTYIQSRTRKNLSYRKIEKIVCNFPTMHAYGIGFGLFSCIPEQTRSQAIDYARYMLTYELDDEIDACVSFIKAIGGSEISVPTNYVRSEYLLHLYASWRKEAKTWPKVMPEGCIAMGTLLSGCCLRVVEEVKPHFLVCVSKSKRQRVENYLSLTQGFQKWPEDEIIWPFFG